MRSPHTSTVGEEREYRAIKCSARHTPATGGEEERDIEPIKCMRSPHTSLQVERRESHRANQVYALTTPQLQVERRESPWSQSSVCARHTPATVGEERESRVNQVYALATHQLQVEMRGSHRANQVYALTTHQLQVERRERHRANQVLCAHHTPATGGEERREDIEPIRSKWDSSEAMICDKGPVMGMARTPGLHPYSLREVPWDFLMTTERVRTSV